jgi:hypothetical protein
LSAQLSQAAVKAEVAEIFRLLAGR